MRSVSIDRCVETEKLNSLLLWPGELSVLTALMQSVSPRRVAEIGVHAGETAAHLLRLIPSIEEYIGIEVVPDYITSLKIQRKEVLADLPGRMAAHDPRFKLIVRKNGSYDVTLEDLGTLDAMFIDGDHSFDGVMNDTDLAIKCVRKGGIIIWHDYYLAQPDVLGVNQVLDRLPSDRQIFRVEGTCMVFERMQ